MSLDRFLKAHEDKYIVALNEIKNGRKITHWMWYIFPQIKGLGHSYTAQYYAIHNKDEAIEYLNHPVLSSHLIEICEALIEAECCDAGLIFGFPDDLKLKSSMTLFYLVSGNDIFKSVLEKFFDGELDKKTELLLK